MVYSFGPPDVLSFITSGRSGGTEYGSIVKPSKSSPSTEWGEKEVGQIKTCWQ